MAVVRHQSKSIITSSDNKVMSGLRKTNLEKVFLLAAVSKDAGVWDFVRLGCTKRCNSTKTIRLFIVHLYTTFGLGSPTRQCLRENEQHLKRVILPCPFVEDQKWLYRDCEIAFSV